MLFYETLYTKSNVSARLIIATFTQQIEDQLNCRLCGIVWLCISIQIMGIWVLFEHLSESNSVTLKMETAFLQKRPNKDTTLCSVRKDGYHFCNTHRKSGN
jgi:hypothetical protein